MTSSEPLTAVELTAIQPLGGDVRTHTNTAYVNDADEVSATDGVQQKTDVSHETVVTPIITYLDLVPPFNNNNNNNYYYYNYNYYYYYYTTTRTSDLFQTSLSFYLCF